MKTFLEFLQESKSDGAQVAKIAKDIAKKHGIKSKAKSESFTGGTSIVLTLFDADKETMKKIEKELSKYESSGYDHNRDIKVQKLDKSIPQVDYIIVKNEITKK